MILFVLVLCGLSASISRSYAAEEKDTWVIPIGSQNEYQVTMSVIGDTIIQKGTHNAASEGLKYKTIGYYMTLVRNEVEDPFHISEDEMLFVYVNTESEVDGDTNTTYYTIQKKMFLDAMVKLGVTSSMLKSKGGQISVYLHNVFQLYDGKTKAVHNSYRHVVGYQEMIAAAKELTDGKGWRSDGDRPTTEVLKSYYNYEYKVKPTLFDVDIVAVDEKGNELGTLKTGETGMYLEKYPLNSSYTAPESYQKGGITYRAKGQWYTSKQRK